MVEAIEQGTRNVPLGFGIYWYDICSEIFHYPLHIFLIFTGIECTCRIYQYPPIIQAWPYILYYGTLESLTLHHIFH